jgi:hypothetical protein
MCLTPNNTCLIFKVGIPKIICGFRDDDGFVCKLEEFKIEALPKIAENPFW